MTTTINSDRAPDPVGAYPHARRVGNLLFLSGVGPRKAGQTDIPGVELDDSGEIQAYDIETQTRSVLHNVQVILEEAGLELGDLVDVTVFLTNMKDDFPGFNSVYAQTFTEHQPCRTTVEVGALPTPIAVELKCIAVFAT